MSGGGTLLSARALTVFSVEKTISWGLTVAPPATTET